MSDQQNVAEKATQQQSDALEARVGEMFDRDPVLNHLSVVLTNARQALHTRQNELVDRAKKELAIEGSTLFESLLWESQAGIH